MKLSVTVGSLVHQQATSQLDSVSCGVALGPLVKKENDSSTGGLKRFTLCLFKGAAESNTVHQGCHHLSCRAKIHQSVCVCVCLFPTGASPSISPPGSDHRAVVPLHRRSSGGTTQVQEGVVQRDALRCCVCGHQPRQRCILPLCDVMLQCL